MPTSASTASDKYCGHLSDDKTEWCLGEPGHRGRHKMRHIPTIAEIAAAGKKEMPMATEPSELTDSEPIEAGIADPYVPTPAEAAKAVGWTPDDDDFINLKGKAYLPARRRIQWMRGEVTAKPDWTIKTHIIEHVIGKRTGVGRVEGGYALMGCEVYDTDGRLISTGLKSEYSENFADYIEKAETGAIARALAVAGFGTESALDLDEGLDKDRIADTPVERKPKLGPSAVPGVGRGGTTSGASVIQIRRISELSRNLALGFVGLAGVVEKILDISVPDLPDDKAMAAFLATLTSAQAGTVIASLEAAQEK